MEKKQFKKRNAILECLQNTHCHPSAEMVHRMLQQTNPDISLATVYRNLSRFKQQGIIQSVATVSGIERFDANTESHIHFICTGCDDVMDLPQQQPALAPNGLEDFQVRQCQITYYGLCPQCGKN